MRWPRQILSILNRLPQSSWLLPACHWPRTAGGREPCLIPSVLLQISIFPHWGDVKITAAARVSADNELLLYTRGGFFIAQPIFFMAPAAFLPWMRWIQSRPATVHGLLCAWLGQSRQYIIFHTHFSVYFSPCTCNTEERERTLRFGSFSSSSVKWAGPVMHPRVTLCSFTLMVAK